MKRILITGGCGFIGSEVVREAISNNFIVMNVDKLSYAGNLDNVASVANHPNYNFVQLDINDQNKLAEIFESFKPDYCLHLAAETHVDRSIDQPHVFIDANILGTLSVLNCSLLYWQKMQQPSGFRLLHISTDEVYGALDIESDSKFSESSRYDPSSPYSASKAASDHLVMAWHKTYGLPAIISNCSNNYGPYQNTEKLIPATILRGINKQPISIYGDGRNVRDWLHVGDHAKALFSLLYNGKLGQSYCVGSDSEYDNLSVVHQICENLTIYLDNDFDYKELITFVADRPGHDRRYAIDNRLLVEQVGCKPSVEFKDGLRETVVWYLNNRSWCSDGTDLARKV
jgi:dTDP-glucose 4,6-dehydratase